MSNLPVEYCGIGGKGEAVATLHDDGYWTWKKGTTPPHESNYAGWRMDVYAAPQAECAPRERSSVEGKEQMTFDEWERTHLPMQHESPNAYARRAFNAGVRADAEKDAALTNEQIEAAIEAWFDTDGKDVDDHQSRMRAAILAANKECT
jgi:hypothetical protein